MSVKSLPFAFKFITLPPTRQARGKTISNASLMSRNKNAMTRYLALDRCFSRGWRRRFYIEDLVEECSRTLLDSTGSATGISRRQVLDDIKFMESSEGWSIKLDRCKDGRRVYYRYSDADFTISEAPLTGEEMEALRHTVQTLRRFSGLPAYGWIDNVMHSLEYRFGLHGRTDSIMGFEQCEGLRGAELLPLFADAILNRKAMRVAYSAFADGGTSEWTLHPYYLKQYNSRWFLFAFNPAFGALTNAPLDRIVSAEVAEGVAYIPSQTDFGHYFDNVVGVTLPRKGEGREVADVVLRFSAERYPYVATKPLHPSQRIADAGRREVALRVVPNKELTARILEFGADVEVVAPASLRNEIRGIANAMARLYGSGNGENKP